MALWGINAQGGVGESPSSSSRPDRERKLTYDVFLSFRGDTRLKFTDHLYAALQSDRLMITFRDKEELPNRREPLQPSLLHAIEESRSAIVVLSKNYANSTWCLDELVKIVDCYKDMGLRIFPIFYEVPISDVRWQEGAFEADFKKHEEEHGRDQVQRWRKAFFEVSNIPGDPSNGYESEVIKKVVRKVRSELYGQAPLGSNDDDGLVGMGGNITEIESIMAERPIEEFIGIYGMGGLGKTTLARAVYDKYKRNDVFDYCFFLPNVRERSEKHDGLTELQRKLLSRPNTSNEIEVDDCEKGKNYIKIRLHERKVLLVLDDVSDTKQLENLAGDKVWFGPRSRIIITTRDQRVLFEHGVDPHHQYKMKFLSPFQSHDLFLRNAFKGNEKPDEDYLKLSKQVIQSANGLPLALKVFGSFLRGRSKAQWEDALKNIHSSKGDYVTRMLEVSLDGLVDNEMDIFLNIACFFNGLSKKYIKQTLRDCGLRTDIGIALLIEKSLVNEEKGRLRLHDTIEYMGQNIVRKESRNAGQRSRIWSLDDAKHVLGNKTGTQEIRGIVLTLDKPDDIISFHPQAFSRMSSLKLLRIETCVEFGDVELPNGLNCLSNTLKVIQWERYPLPFLPENTQFDQLVDLQMRNSKLKQLWRGGTKPLNNLKSIDLSYSMNLTKTPDFNETPDLQKLILEGCIDLVNVHPSLGQHKNLI